MERKRVHQRPRSVALNVSLKIVLLTTVCNVGRSSDEPITCDAGHFVLGQNGSLTCLFRQNMIGSKRHIYVLHYPFQSSNDFAGNDVLRCSGLYLRKPICIVADGYQFHGDISDRLTLTIPGVKSSHAGRYVCQLVPPDGRPMQFCNLTVEGNNQHEIKPVLTTHSTDVNSASESGNGDIMTYFAFSAVIAILLGVIAYFAITRWKQKRNEIARKRNPEDPAAASMIRSGDAQQGKTTCSVTAQTGKSLENFKSSLKKLSLTADKT